MEIKNETQDIALENNETEVVEETSSEPSAREKELEAEIGKMKRLLKKQERETDTSKETSTKKTDKENKEFGLLELTYLKVEEITTDEEVDFVKSQLEEAGLSKDQLPKLLKNKYFQAELKEFKDAKATEKAVSGIKGSGSGGDKATDTPEYWIAKGVPPTKEQIPDRKTRATIARAMMSNSSTSGKKFYND